MANFDVFLSNQMLRWTYSSEVFAVKNVNLAALGQKILFRYDAGRFVIETSDGIPFGEICFGPLFVALLQYHNNAQYKIYGETESFDIEKNSIIVAFAFYRLIDIETDPYTVRYDFQLINTTKKDDGYSRQENYYGLKIGDTVIVERRVGSAYGYVANAQGRTLGDLNEKAVNIFAQSRLHTTCFKVCSFNFTPAKSIIAVIRMYILDK